MLEQDQDITENRNVKLLWDDLQYIKIQLQNLKSDLRYVTALIIAFERELSYVKVSDEAYLRSGPGGVPCQK